MDYKDFSKKELAEILDIIQSTLTCRTENDVLAAAGRGKELVSADMSVCALGETSTGRLLKVANDNWPGGRPGAYRPEEHFKNDTIFPFNLEHSRAYTWSESQRRFPEKQFIDLMNRAAEFRLKYGISSGISLDGPSWSIFSFAGDCDRFTGHHLRVLDIVTPHLHQAFVRVCGAQPRADFELSTREREVLGWMKEGKTNWEISVILSISERTVKFHVQNIERKLNAVNKAHAIAIALDNGLVT